ncbi:DNA fragmentation factor subunit beta [Latimeria chalumnae]|uniref:DNA fragmentation factor subunit beta n=1 Tax=Latimeria chalumnae TaxID=7897 RepID=H3BIK5_LATCH|nr:PREDICTED: DNA fragmentation factor subunit beta [Latimeria chalumnae]
MFGIFTTKKLKIFKLRSANSDQKYGIAAKNMKDLLHKGCKIFQITKSGCRLCLYEDGTELSENYFQNLPANTELVILAAGQTWNGYAYDIVQVLNDFDEKQDEIIKAAQTLLSDEQAPKRRKILQDLVYNLNENSSAETKEEDKQWFEGVESRFKSKSDYMNYSCQSRIRSYMKEVDGYTTRVNPTSREEYKRIAEVMLQQLKSAKYNGCYFDRREKTKRLCTREGWFSCQGAFDTEQCSTLHSINPYGNKESRILFSTWNLDHMIEKKRTIVPALAAAVEGQSGAEVNWEYFYRLLFTKDNLRLVHVACHKKTSHNLSCDKAKIYKKSRALSRAKPKIYRKKKHGQKV